MDITYDPGRGRDSDGRPSVSDTGPGQFADSRDPAAARAWLIAALIALGLILLLLMALIAARGRAQTAAVQRHNIVAWETLSGTAIAPPNKYAVINCHCDAPVSRVFATVGETVRQGDAIVELSHPNVQAAYAAASQELTAAQEAYNGTRDAIAGDLRQAQQELAQAVDAQSAPSASPPRTGVKTAAATIALGASDVTRPGNVAIPVSSVTADEARARVTEAQQRLQQALVPLQQRLTAAQQSFQEASSGLSQAYIRAPVDGQALELHARLGQPISTVPDTRIATIADLSAVTIRAPLTADQEEGVKVGRPVQVRVPELPDQPLSGMVQRIKVELAPAVDGRPRQLRRVAIITFVNDQGLVKPDMMAKVLVQTAELRSVLCVPNGAVERDRDGEPFVRVRHDGRWVVTTVRTGPSDGAQTAILAGLQEGQIVRFYPHRNQSARQTSPLA